jgi:chorismate mutase
MRREMDRLNAELAALLQRRARLVREIGRRKRALGLGAADPAREREMLARVLARAPRGFERAELARIFRAVFAASRRLVVRARR